MLDKQPLVQIFRNEKQFAWDLLQTQCYLQINHQINVHDVMRLSQIYRKAIERLNVIQDQRQKYFSNKMQKLMSQPYVIRCFNNQNNKKQSVLDHKRKEIQQKISSESQKHNNQIFQEMIYQHQQKTKKMKEKYDKQIKKLDKHLQWRIMKRNSFRQQKITQYQTIKCCEKSPSQITNDTPERNMFKKKIASSIQKFQIQLSPQLSQQLTRQSSSQLNPQNS